MAEEETLRRCGRSKALHLSLSSSDRNMRTFGSVVQPLAPTVQMGKAKVTERGIVGAIAIGDDRSGHEPVVLQQFAHQSQCCIFVAPGLNENAENLPFIIDGTPEIHSPTVDRDMEEYLRASVQFFE